MEGSSKNLLKKNVILLYRHILKAHSIYLKEDMRVFGDFFVKSEFNLIYSNGNEDQMSLFTKTWTDYYNQIIKNNIIADNGLLHKLDLDQMKSLKDIEKVIKL